MMDSTTLKEIELSKKDFPQTWSVLEAGINQGVTPGIVAGIWLKQFPDHYWAAAVGNRRTFPCPLPLSTETVFDLASISKVFATATLAAVLVDRGWLQFDDSLSKFLTGYPYPDIKIRHLLSHTSGLAAWQPLWQKIRDYYLPEPIFLIPVEKRQEIMRKLVSQIPPDFKPGEKAIYSDVSFLLLGFALEEITQMPLDRAVRKFVWEPLGIRNAFYRRVTQSVTQGALESVAATEDCPWRGGVLQGQVHDDNCWAMGGYGGHAGVFGAVRDVIHFARGLTVEKFLSLATRRDMWTKVTEPKECGRTLGWDTPSNENSSVGPLFSKHSVGHLGFTGTSLWIDLDAELAVVLLTNRVHPSRENWKIKEYRPLFHEAIRLDLNSILRKNKDYES